jgi:hypothetical protein
MMGDVCLEIGHRSAAMEALLASLQPLEAADDAEYIAFSASPLERIPIASGDLYRYPKNNFDDGTLGAAR